MMAISLGVHILKIVINLPITARCFRIGQILRVGRKLARFGRMTGQINNLNKYCEYEPPHLDPAINEELQEFVAKRIEEGGAPTDY